VDERAWVKFIGRKLRDDLGELPHLAAGTAALAGRAPRERTANGQRTRPHKPRRPSAKCQELAKPAVQDSPAG